MTRTRLLGAAVMALFAIMAVTASAAFAESEWLANGAVITTALASHGETLGTETVTLEDDGTGIAVLCKTKFEGTVGPGKADTITKVTLEGCTSSITIDSVTAINLPWKTEVTLSGAKFMDKLTSGEASKEEKSEFPGYLVEGVVLGFLIDDACTKKEAFTELTNGTGEEVFSNFNTEEKANCTAGGKEVGLVHGIVDIFLNAGGPLRVS